MCYCLRAKSGIKPGKSVVFWGLEENSNYPAVAVVCLGKRNKGYNSKELLDEDLQAIRVAAADGCRTLQSLGFKEIDVEGLGYPEAAAEGCTLGTWKFQGLKTKKEEPPSISFYGDEKDKTLWDKGVIKANSQNIARKLADMPSNHMTPTIFAEEADNLLSPLGIDIKVYNTDWIKEQNMGAFLSVSKGSDEPPIFLELTYSGGDSDTSPVVLVGKGVTFDSGGISLKGSAAMDEMRGDMSGAAVLVGTLYGVALLKIPINIKVLIPLCENMPSGRATKPGDVVIAKNGKTICVDNTDAEGRLILADALCYSAELDPCFVLDIATLTGAIRVALGDAATGVFTNSDALYEALQKSGTKTGDRVWRFPLWNHYAKQVLEFQGFDINNVGKGKGGGSCTAAAFLREFAPKDKSWMHLDIAGVMMSSPGDEMSYLGKGMSGRPTRTLIEFIKSSVKN